MPASVRSSGYDTRVSPLPTDANGANTELLHPIFVRRLEALFSAVPGLVVVSGARTYQEQLALYEAYKNGTGNFASNPDAGWGAVNYFGETFGRYGSNHQVQSTGWAYAADLGGPLDAAHQVARTYGLHFPIPGERWHAQPLRSVTTPYDYDPDPTEDEMSDGMYVKNGGTIAYTDGVSLVGFTSTDSYKEHREMFDPEQDLPAPREISSALWSALRKDK